MKMRGKKGDLFIWVDDVSSNKMWFLNGKDGYFDYTVLFGCRLTGYILMRDSD